MRPLHENEAFYFFENVEKFTGKRASNLAEFCDIMKDVDKKSILFHFKRRDFEKWIKETLRDPTLARRIGNIKEPKSEEELRTLIHKISKKRLEELNKKLHNNPKNKARKRTKIKGHYYQLRQRSTKKGKKGTILGKWKPKKKTTKK